MEIKNMTGNDLMVNINNVLYSYDDEGTGTIPVIFIHGFPFGKQTWQPQLAAISKTNRAIAYDIRGYGKSEPGSEVPGIGLYADDLINFMDALEIEKAIVCGLSMGGYILLNAVTLCPHRFKAVILCDTQCIADTPEIKDSRNKVITQIIAGKKAEFADGFLGKVFSNDSLENKKELVQQNLGTRILVIASEKMVLKPL